MVRIKHEIYTWLTEDGYILSAGPAIDRLLPYRQKAISGYDIETDTAVPIDGTLHNTQVCL